APRRVGGSGARARVAADRCTFPTLLMLSFTATLDPEGGAAIEVPASVISDLRAVDKRPTVVVMIRGMEVRTRIMVYGGRSYIGLRQAQRTAIGLSPGDSLQVEIALDSEPRVVS